MVPVDMGQDVGIEMETINVLAQEICDVLLESRTDLFWSKGAEANWNPLKDSTIKRKKKYPHKDYPNIRTTELINSLKVSYDITESNENETIIDFTLSASPDEHVVTCERYDRPFMFPVTESEVESLYSMLPDNSQIEEI